MGTLECPMHGGVIHLSFWTTGVWSSWIHVIHSGIHSVLRLRVVPHFSSGIVERAKRERAWNSPLARKVDTPRVAFSRVGDFNARSRFACSTIPEEKWGTTRSLFCSLKFNCHVGPSSTAGDSITTSITLSGFSVSHVYLSIVRQFLVFCTLRAVVSPGRTLEKPLLSG